MRVAPTENRLSNVSNTLFVIKLFETFELLASSEKREKENPPTTMKLAYGQIYYYSQLYVVQYYTAYAIQR